MSERLETAIPGWDHEPSLDGAWAIAQAGPLRDGLRCWFDGLAAVPLGAESQEVA